MNAQLSAVQGHGNSATYMRRAWHRAFAHMHMMYARVSPAPVLELGVAVDVTPVDVVVAVDVVSVRVAV